MARFSRIFRNSLMASVALGLASGAASAAEGLPSQEEMWRIIQEQSRLLEEQRGEIDALKDMLGVVQEEQAETEASVAAVQETATQAQAAAVEAQLATADAAAMGTAQAPDPLLPQSSAGAGGWWDRTSVGGYGELHYQGGDVDRVDFHRFVVFLGHEFNEDIRMFSELEVEHALAGESQPGEIELEQAYIQMDLNDQTQLNAGLQLVPVGILNETHEPPTFFGVERNPVESNIIPSTWWEAGVGIAGNLGATGISYDAMASSGLNVPLTGSSAFRIRNGRQKVANATARSGALTGRLAYTGIPGLEIAASGHYEFDVTQGAGDPLSGDSVPGFLFTTHADARFGGFGLRALYASWWLDGPSAELIGRDRQTGFYLEPSYRFPINGISIGGQPSELGVFYRYSWWDNNAGIDALNLGTDQHIFGLNYWPHSNVVFKLDYLRDSPDSGGGSDRFDAGVGFQF